MNANQAVERLTRATCTFPEHIDRAGVGWSRFQLADVQAVLGALEAAEARALALEGAWNWLGSDECLSLEYGYSDVEGDQGEWRVYCESGGRSDREWDLIGAGATPLHAVQAARALLLQQKEAEA